MTELDHTSFDTLVADLDLIVGDGEMGCKPRIFRFVYHDNNHPPSMPWFPLKMERKQFSAGPIGVCDGIRLKFAYGSMDGGSWITTIQSSHTFMLRYGYLYDEAGGMRRIALVDDDSSSLPVSADDSLNDQLNKNLRGVFS